LKGLKKMKGKLSKEDICTHLGDEYSQFHGAIVPPIYQNSLFTRKEQSHGYTYTRISLFGASMDPHQAWLLIRGLRTLPLRMKQHQENAMIVASFLEDHSKVERVLYPGLPSHPQYELGKNQMTGYTGLMSFITKAAHDDVMGCMKSLRYFEEGPSWGGFESLFNTPGIGISEQVSEQMGIPRGLVRISVGLENVNSLVWMML
jgi:cystathionine beta-lyase/cystathionine gamma-synthase